MPDFPTHDGMPKRKSNRFYHYTKQSEKPNHELQIKWRYKQQYRSQNCDCKCDLDDYKTRRSKTKAEPKIDTSGYDDVYMQNRYRSTTKLLKFLLGMMYKQNG